MNTTQAQQNALDDALVAPVDHLEFEKCNLRLKTNIKPKEATFQVVMDALALTLFYRAFLITTDKPVQVTKGTRIKTKAKVAKSDKKKQPAKKPKAKGLAMLSEVALTKSEQLKLATKRSKKDFYISHASGSADGIDIESKVIDEHQQNTSGIDEGTDSDEEDDDENDFEDDADNNDSDDISKSDDERTKSNRYEIPDPNLANVDQTEHEKEDVDERVQTPSDYELTDDEKIHDEENIDEEEEDEVIKELYDDVNVNLRNNDIEMINADQGASEQLNASQLLRFEQEEEDVHVTLTLILDTQKTGVILDVATPVIEKNVTESLEAVILTRSSFQPQSSYEAAATLSEFELTKILIDKIKKNKSFDVANYKRELYDALVKSYNTDKDIFESYGEVSSLKRSQDDKDKDQDPSTGSDRGTKRRKSSKDVESSRYLRSKEKKSSSIQQDQEFVTRDNDEQPADKEVTKDDWFKKPKRPPTPDPDWSTCKSITELEYHLKECSKARTERLDCHNPKNKPYPFDLKKPLPFIQDHQGRKTIPKDYFINIDLEYMKGGDLSRKYLTYGPKRQGFYGYASNLTSSKDVYSRRRIIMVTRLKIMKKYDYSHLEEIEVRRDDQELYTFKEGDFKRLRLQDVEDIRKRLMRIDELHKFSDGTLNDVWSALYDIFVGIRIECLPMRRWSNLDKKKAQVMVQDIDRKLYQRRLMRNLEKCVGGRVYGNDLRLLERTI
uniref:Uncharacterized protein n=1 Tax=Tanacetum cinerariifolium TaxID=118510 RepID=A0A699GTJ2_TANCI|nr:hypothetical protein [Tanacetum cinerariifolium]